MISDRIDPPENLGPEPERCTRCGEYFLAHLRQALEAENSKLKRALIKVPMPIAPAGDFNALVRSFPSLDRFFRDRDIDVQLLDDWACNGASSGERHAVRFVCNVWNGAYEWKCGKFDVIAAFGVWDEAHMRAFQAWASDPWRP